MKVYRNTSEAATAAELKRQGYGCQHEQYEVVEDHQYEHRLECRCLDCGEVFWRDY